MKKYHFSVLFKNSVIRHHGDFTTALSQVSDIVKKAKIALVDKLEAWQQAGENIIEFEIYTQEREVIYTFKK